MKTIEIRVSHMRIFGHTVRQVREPRQVEPATDDLLPISKKLHATLRCITLLRDQ